MRDKNTSLVGRIALPVAFIAMIAVGKAAGCSLINSDYALWQFSAYGSQFFSPSHFTFLIWKILYLFFAGYVLFYLGIFCSFKTHLDISLLEDTGILFVLSCAAQTVWSCAESRHALWLALPALFALTVSIIAANKFTHGLRAGFKIRFFVRLPFSIYLGWILVVLSSRVLFLLFAVNWPVFGGINEPLAAAVATIFSALTGCAFTIAYRDAAISTTMIWAFFGILHRHTSFSGLDGSYPAVIIASTFAIFLLFASSAIALLQRFRK
jgi:benzodiazapine receptor